MKKVLFIILILVGVTTLGSTVLGQEKPTGFKPEVKIKGYGQFQYVILTETGKFDDLQVKRFRLVFDGRVTEKLGYKAYFDLEAATSARVREAILYYDLGTPAKLKLSSGQQFVPFSYDHLLSSSKREIAERSKVTSSLAPGREIKSPGDRDIGLVLHGKGKYIGDFSVGLFQGGAEIKEGKFAGAPTEKVDNRKDLALRVVHKDLGVKGLSAGFSYYNGALSTSTVTSRNRAGLEAVYHGDAFSAQAEYMFGKDPFTADLKPSGKTIKKKGYYLQAGYKIKPIHPEFQVVGRYGYWDPDSDKADNEETQLTLAINWWFDKKARVLFDYTKNTEKPTDVNNDITTLRLQLDF